MSADRIVMTASRLLGAMAACEILLQLDIVNCIGMAESARVICQRIFNVGADDFLLKKLLLNSVSKSLFFPLASRSGFGAAILSAFARSSNVFCNSVSVMAASRLLGAMAACVILLSFAAGHRKS